MNVDFDMSVSSRTVLTGELPDDRAHTAAQKHGLTIRPYSGVLCHTGHWSESAPGEKALYAGLKAPAREAAAQSIPWSGKRYTSLSRPGCSAHQSSASTDHLIWLATEEKAWSSPASCILIEWSRSRRASLILQDCQCRVSN